jgi:hypothetical protein
MRKLINPQTAFNISTEVLGERKAQDEKWGQQDHPDGTGGPLAFIFSEEARQDCEDAFAYNTGTWRHILREEVYEAFAESDPARLREELIQVAAVAQAWVEAIDRRSA